MWGKCATRLAVYLLEHSKLEIEQRSILTGCILAKLAALPLHDIVSVDEQGTLLINQKPIDMETARQLRESAQSALANTALSLIEDQVLFQAITLGVHKVENERQMFFARAAIWWGQRQHELLKILAGKDGNSSLN